MQLTLHEGRSYNVVSGYDARSITVNEQRFELSVLVMPEGPVRQWAASQVDELTDTMAEELIDLDPELVVVGTGQTQVFPAVAFLRRFARHGVGCEIMDTGAACRTYNVLASENRQVLGALMLPTGC